MKELFQNEDFEREREIFKNLEDKLHLCEKEVNNEKYESPSNQILSDDNLQN